MNEKGTNFCSFPVGLEPATPAYEAVTQSIPPPRTLVWRTEREKEREEEKAREREREVPSLHVDFSVGGLRERKRESQIDTNDSCVR